jgi:UDP-N-acetylmuramyl pentapeptide phosphotransferase/UDP-N-acetylglucosamine-1-phosphate transferase
VVTSTQILAAAAFAALSSLSTRLLSPWLAHSGVIDRPTERSSHTVPTPRGGGLSIVVVSSVGLIWYLRDPQSTPEAAATWVVCGALVVSVVGWIDDLRGLSPLTRLSIDVGTAVLVLAHCGPARVFLPVLGSVELGHVWTLFVVIWIAGLTNAYNFMDGVDGLAAGQAVVAGVSWFVIGKAGSNEETAGLILGATSAGFLVHNWQPARVFMGDVGSRFLGFWFACLPLLASREDPRAASVGLALMWPFAVDTGLTLLRRVRARQNVLQAHREHLYQRLNRIGYSHSTVTLLYMALSSTCAGFGILWLRGVGWAGPGFVWCLSAVGALLPLGVELLDVRQKRTSGYSSEAPL